MVNHRFCCHRVDNWFAGSMRKDDFIINDDTFAHELWVNFLFMQGDSYYV